MVVTEAPVRETTGPSDGAPTLLMPSQRHSVVAKAKRYREEPDRLLLVTDNPLTVVINGFHGNYTVVQTKAGLICSCERFRRAGSTCGHVLAVEQRFVDSPSSMTAAEVAEFITCASEAPAHGEASKPGLLEHVVVPVWDVTENSAALLVARSLARTAGGRLTMLSVEPGDRNGGPLVDTTQTLDRLVTSSSWDGLAIAVIERPNLPQPGADIGLPATLVVVPIEPASQGSLQLGRELTTRLHDTLRVPLLAVPSGAQTASGQLNVVAAVDGSPSSLTVLAAAVSLVRPLGARLILVHVGPRQADWLPTAARPSARDWVDITTERLRSMGISATGRAMLGHPVGAIESAADAENADIVMLATSTGSVPARLGQTARTLLRRSSRPLLLVRSDACVGSYTARVGVPS
jgi:nucleotide-binding universal stress UspA family protein